MDTHGRGVRGWSSGPSRALGSSASFLLVTVLLQSEDGGDGQKAQMPLTHLGTVPAGTQPSPPPAQNCPISPALTHLTPSAHPWHQISDLWKLRDSGPVDRTLRYWPFCDRAVFQDPSGMSRAQFCPFGVQGYSCEGCCHEQVSQVPSRPWFLFFKANSQCPRQLSYFFHGYVWGMG